LWPSRRATDDSGSRNISLVSNPRIIYAVPPCGPPSGSWTSC
jgi:hypothetical protein